MKDKKADILNAGRELFYSKGFRNTKVSDIARTAGIGTGTFYGCFSSKEELFLEIYIKESEVVKKRLVDAIDRNNDPVSMVTNLVTQSISAINSNPILKEWYNRGLNSKLEQFFYEQGCFEGFNEFIHSGKAELNISHKGEGRIRGDLNDELISAIFNSILYIDIHKSEIGIRHFPQILHYITEFIIKGLSDCLKSTDSGVFFYHRMNEFKNIRSYKADQGVNVNLLNPLEGED